MKEKDLRMVFWVPYNISEIQKGIQAGHAALEYVMEKEGDTILEKQYIEFIRDHKSWMIYSGGTTNSEKIDIQEPHLPVGNFRTEYKGSLNNIQLKLKELGISYSTFNEPDLNNALSAICCIIDYNLIDFENFIEDVDELSNFIREQRFA